jgi:hypothetical protein
MESVHTQEKNIEQPQTAQPSHNNPTYRQEMAIRNLVANGGSKADAIREAGYSEVMARNPQRVFNSPKVQALLDEAEIDIVPVLKNLNRGALKAKKLQHMVFPTYRDKSFSIEGTQEDGVEEDEDILDALEMEDGVKKEKYLVERGRAMSDKDICEMLEEQGFRVRRIQHGETARHVYFWIPDEKAMGEATEKIINLFGLYAPKKVDTKNEHYVFNLTSLRKEMRIRDIKITDPIIHEQSQPENSGGSDNPA